MLQVAAPPSDRKIRQAHILSNAQPRQSNSHPPFKISVTRPLSTLNDSPDQYKYGSSQLPALAALASLAACAPAAPVKRESDSDSESKPSHSPDNNMSQPQYAPAATAGGQQNGPPVCQNCTTSTTPLWRRDEAGSVLCNACGLFLKLHGRPRPISLKTDVIKSRNRVKTSQTPRKHDRNGNPTDISHQPGPGFPAAHPDVAHAHGGAPPYLSHGLPPAPQMGSGAQNHDRLASPGASLSRSGTPSQHHHNPNIAPQHIFDTVSMPADSFASPGQHHLEAPQSYDAVAAQNNALRTRVSELEVINDLFRGRVSELEASEQEARREVDALRQELETLKRGNASANNAEEAVQQQHHEQEQEQKQEQEQDLQERSPKRARTDDGPEPGEAGFAEFTRSEESQEGQEGQEVHEQ
ncbi:hypothetical protein Q7P37_000104 [Cladosporium fusiforme]